jgi:hypothetical protein
MPLAKTKDLPACVMRKRKRERITIRFFFLHQDTLYGHGRMGVSAGDILAVALIVLDNHRCADSCLQLHGTIRTVPYMIAINLCYAIFITAELTENVHMCMST